MKSDLQRAAQIRWQHLGSTIRIHKQLSFLLKEYKKEIEIVEGDQLTDTLIRAINHRFTVEQERTRRERELHS